MQSPLPFLIFEMKEYKKGDIVLCKLIEECSLNNSQECEERYYGYGCSNCRYNTLKWEPIEENVDS